MTSAISAVCGHTLYRVLLTVSVNMFHVVPVILSAHTAECDETVRASRTTIRLYYGVAVLLIGRSSMCWKPVAQAIQRQLCGYARGLATQRPAVPHEGNTMVTQLPNGTCTIRPLHNWPSASPREMTLSALWHEPIKPLDTWAAMASRRTALLRLTVSGTSMSLSVLRDADTSFRVCWH